MTKLCLLFSFCAATAVLSAPASSPVSFKKIQATDQFWAEGAHCGDFNKDGKMDVVSGPFWYAGPDFQKRYEIYPATASFERTLPNGTKEKTAGWEGALGENNAYADCFLTYTWDFNQDGWMDVIVYPHPGTEVAWYENPKGKKEHWPKHVVFDVLDNESPGFADITGDGKPEMLCCSKGFLGYVEADWSKPQEAWKFHAVSPKGDYQRYSHGIGYGDIDGDGDMDLLDKDAWWEQPSSREGDPLWKRHAFPFSPAAAQMLVYDFNGDGLNDVLTTLNPHGYGLVWHEQTRNGKEISFKTHEILASNDSTNKLGIQFSQAHALELADIDGDGLKDLVTGKRFWAHGKNGPDPDSNGAAVLYWFKLTRPAPGKAEFVPHLIDAASGVGTQVTVARVNEDDLLDIVVGNKRGVFVFLQEKLKK